MSRRTALVLTNALFGVLAASPASAGCPGEDRALLFHSCHGPAAAELLLLPEEADALEVPETGSTLTVTGAYTGTDTRADGRPNPVGLFVDDGRVISPNLARMDGILVIDAEGRPSLHRSTAVPLEGRTIDLTDPDSRMDFAWRAAEQGHSVMQSHLLVIEGGLDVRDQPGAPLARRRLLFTDEAGWGVYETAAAVTLYDAAIELQERHRPEMAMNLDMGSFDYCMMSDEGAVTNCGVLGATQIEKLSNLLRFFRQEP